MQIAVDVKKASGPKLKDFREALESSTPPALVTLREEVEEFAKQFPTVGFERATMRYQR